MFRQIFLFTTLLFLSFSSTIFAQDDDNKKDASYDKIIKKATETQKGLFTIYRTKEELYFEIADSVLDKDMLMAVRVSEVSENNKIEAGRMLRDPILIRFAYRNGSIAIRMPQTRNVVKKDETNIKQSFWRNNISPIMETFSIEAVNPDSTGYVIKVTDFFSKEIPFVSPFHDRAKPGKYESSGSYIDEIRVFPKNIEISAYLAYTKKTRPFLAKLNRSIVLLPEEPMPMRLHDRRIGFYTLSKRVYSSKTNRLESKKYIKRWNIRPKPEDMDKYFAGELVEPEKPIVYYYDNSFPEAYKKYIKEGIECWQPAFEAIGFKNAIIAKEYPENDPDFHSEDIRYSCIRYITSSNANAMGPSWIDPRTGEIIQAGVLFYHNVVKLIHDWRFVQTAAVDEDAREKIYSDELMGELIRYVIAHEIGHTLGQEHNMRGSYAYPVDSLRSPTFTEKYGSTASIMDYARNNYVAQPGDGVTWLSPPKLGPYDYFSIKYGYKLIRGVEKPEDEYATLNRWLVEKMDDPVYIFGEQTMGIPVDPASQQEALGDDAIKATKYGIANAKVIMKNLIDWTAEKGKDYEYTKEIYDEILKQYNRYIYHLLPYIGGSHIYYPVHGQNLNQFEPIPKAKQKQALTYFFECIRDEANWLITDELEQKIGFHKKEIYKEQLKKLDWLMGKAIFVRFELYGKLAKGESAYTPAEYMKDLHLIVWQEALSGKPINDFEKQLLTGYVNNLSSLSSVSDNGKGKSKYRFYQEPFISENMNTISANQNLERINASKEVDFVDVAVEPLLLEEIERTKDVLEKLSRKANKKDKAFYKYLLLLLK